MTHTVSETDKNFEIRDFINTTVSNIQPSGIRKFFDIVNTMGDAISLGVGEPDFVTPEHIRNAGIHSMEKRETRYTSNAGITELRIEIYYELNTSVFEEVLTWIYALGGNK